MSNENQMWKVKMETERDARFSRLVVRLGNIIFPPLSQKEYQARLDKLIAEHNRHIENTAVLGNNPGRYSKFSVGMASLSYSFAELKYHQIYHLQEKAFYDGLEIISMDTIESRLHDLSIEWKNDD